MTLAIDGSNVINYQNTASTTTPTITLTTTKTNDVIIVAAAGAFTVTSVTATGLTFTLRASIQNSATAQWFYEYWAPAASAFNGTITVTTGGSGINISLIVFGVSGSPSYLSPFDSNASMPASSMIGATASNDNTQTGLSTTSVNDMIIGLFSCNSTIPITDPSNFTNIETENTNNPTEDASYDNITGTYNNQSLTWIQTTGGGEPYEIIVDALISTTGITSILVIPLPLSVFNSGR
ncbi:MAG: hypothetical protein WA549_00145 [Thermoplasmata archaeon]